MPSVFEEMGLCPELIQAVEKLGYETPTPIQLAAIPALLEGRNVVGQAQTGTGKTAAFVLPMLQQIQPGSKGIQGLVLTPTRELAIQVTEAARKMAKYTPLRVMAVYGGQSYTVQTRQIERGVEVVVGTPGRLLDLIRQNLLALNSVRYLVLDEADEMLEMGFIEDVQTILAQVPAERQTALFSATLPDAVRKLAERYVSDPHAIRIDPTRRTVAETEQRYCRVREENKLEALARMLEVEEVKSALIFARTKARAQDLSDELIRRDYPAQALHGDLNQARREYVLNRFRDRTITLLVATDVAARGLDSEDVSHVINYDAPGDAEDYIHRIGRTGRAGRKGIAITFFTPRERTRLKQIEAYTRQPMVEYMVPSREQILNRRDERFLVRLVEQLSHFEGRFSREFNLVNQLAGSYDLADIAAVAIQLARAGESDLPFSEMLEAAAEDRPGRASRQGQETENSKPARRAKKEWPGRSGREQETGMVRLRMNLGGIHGVRPGDVVGAIAGEVGIPGRAIGEIDIRKDCTFVDVAEKHVGLVLRESGGKYSLRGNPVTLTLAS